MDSELHLAGGRPTDCGFLGRLEMLENNLTRVSNQHDALLPLLDLVELLPHVQKNLEQCRQVKQRLQELEGRLTHFNSELKEHINHGALSSVEGNFKSSQAQLQELRARVRDVHEGIGTAARHSLQHMKEEASAVIRTLDQRLETSRGQVGQFLREFKHGLGEIERSARQQPSSELFREDRECFSNELDNVKREIGLLQCEMEYLMDLDRTTQIRNAIKNLGGITPAERNFSIGHLEQNLFVEEYEMFEESNTNRLKYELQLLDNSVNGLLSFAAEQARSNRGDRQAAQTQLAFVEDRHYSLANQIKGSELKKLLETKRLANRMNKIGFLMNQLTADELKNMTAKVREVDLLRKRMQNGQRIAQGSTVLLRRRLSELGARLSHCHATLG